MMHFEVFSLNDAEKWKSKIELFPTEFIDIYFYPEYYQSWQSIYSGKVLCFYVEINSAKIIYPFIKREIKEYDLDDCYYDISSVYGYGGAIPAAIDIDVKIKKSFSSLFSDWCKKENIIAEFIREYPNATARYIDNTKRILVRTNVSVDTTRDEEAIWQDLPKRARRDVRYASKKKLNVEIDSELRTIDDFYNLYCETAKDRHFEPFYHFHKDYFIDLKKYLGNKSIIINVREKSKIVAAALCFHSNDKLTYHLGVSRSDKLFLCPNDLLYWEMIKQAINRGCKELNLGGGMSTNPNDSLYLFKKKFGKCETPIFIETCIHNIAIYKNICHQWDIRHQHLLNDKGHYFLKYREI